MTIESESPPIPQNEFFPTTDSSGKVVLFHVYVDTYLLITEGAQKEGVVVTESTEDIDFIKIVTKKFKRNFVSLLRSITNTRGANLSNDIMLHLFDEDGKLYTASNYKKSIYALLLDKDTKVSNFYETDSSSDFLPKDSNIECNTAYFTFKMRFKYKLLDFVVQFELGHNLYQDNNIVLGGVSINFNRWGFDSVYKYSIEEFDWSPKGGQVFVSLNYYYDKFSK